MASQPPLANIITLGVHDLARERGFYQQLGWPIVLDSDDFIVFELRGARCSRCSRSTSLPATRTPKQRHPVPASEPP